MKLKDFKFWFLIIVVIVISMLFFFYDRSLRFGFRDGSFDNKPKINKEVKDIEGFKYEDFTLEGYDPHPLIKGKVSV